MWVCMIARLGGMQRERELTYDRGASDRQRQILKYVFFTMMVRGLSRKRIEP